MTSTLTPPTTSSDYDELDPEATSKQPRTKFRPVTRNEIAAISFIAGLVVALAMVLLAANVGSGQEKVEQPSDIRSVYANSIIVTAREGDTLKSVADATFPTLIASEKDLAAYVEAWQDEIAIRSRSTGTVVTGDRLVIPALPDEPGSIKPEDLPRALEKLRK